MSPPPASRTAIAASASGTTGAVTRLRTISHLLLAALAPVPRRALMALGGGTSGWSWRFDGAVAGKVMCLFRDRLPGPPRIDAAVVGCGGAAAPAAFTSDSGRTQFTSGAVFLRWEKFASLEYIELTASLVFLRPSMMLPRRRDTDSSSSAGSVLSWPKKDLLCDSLGTKRGAVDGSTDLQTVKLRPE